MRWKPDSTPVEIDLPELLPHLPDTAYYAASLITGGTQESDAFRVAAKITGQFFASVCPPYGNSSTTSTRRLASSPAGWSPTRALTATP